MWKILNIKTGKIVASGISRSDLQENLSDGNLNFFVLTKLRERDPTFDLSNTPQVLKDHKVILDFSSQSEPMRKRIFDTVYKERPSHPNLQVGRSQDGL